jgi:hypothetical protein
MVTGKYHKPLELMFNVDNEIFKYDVVWGPGQLEHAYNVAVRKIGEGKVKVLFFDDNNNAKETTAFVSIQQLILHMYHTIH